MPPYGVRGGHSTAPPGAHRIYLSPPDQVFFSPTKFGPTPAGPRPPATPYSRSETRMLAARNAPLQRVSLETPTNRARLPTNAPAPHFSPALRDLATETTQAADRPTLGHAPPSAQGQAPSEAGAFIHFSGARCTGKPRAASPAWSIHPPGSRHRSAPPAHLGIYLEVIKRRGTIYGRRLPPLSLPATDALASPENPGILLLAVLPASPEHCHLRRNAVAATGLTPRLGDTPSRAW